MRKVYTLLLSVIFFGPLTAQWTTNTLLNTEVSNTGNGDAQTIAASDGKTWVAFYKSVPAPNYYEMRAQLMDKNGVKLLGPEGVVVNNIQHASFSSVFSCTIDANDNLIVAIAATTSPNTIYVNKISPAGTQVWGAAGISFANGLVPKLTVLTNNDVIISWLDVAVGTRGYMQKLASSNGAPQWATPVIIVPTIASHRTSTGHLVPLSGNGFISIIHDRVSTSVTSTLWAQRYDADGVPQWPSLVQLATASTAYNRNYSPVMHNDTLFLGYNGSVGLRTDGYLQRLNPDGTIPWGINGSDFATDNTYYEFDTKVVITPNGKDVWTSSRVTNTAQGNQGTYVQKFNKQTGARLFTDNGKVVYPVIPVPYVTPVAISTYSDNLPVLLLQKYNTAISQYMYATKLDANGSFVWPGDTVALGTFAAAKSRVELTRGVNDQAVAFWVENKGTTPLPYGQPIRINGATGVVPPVANFTTGSTTVCRGSAVQYRSTSTGYVASYSWSFPGGTPATSTAANPVVTYNTNGVYNVALTVTNEAGTNTFTQNNYVTVNGVTPTAALTGNATACGGSVTTFTVTGTNLGTAPVYTWRVNGNIVAGSGSTFTYSNIPGTYQISCSVTSNAVCANPAIVTTNTINYVIYPYTDFQLVASPYVNVYPGLFTTIFAINVTPAPSTVGIYTWTKNGSVIPGATGSSITIDEYAEYRVTVTDVNGCTVTKNILINYLKVDKLFIYSNPNDGRFQVRYFGDAIPGNRYTLNVFDTKGAKVYSKGYTANTYYERMDVNMANAASGLYLVELRETTGKQVATGKVIVQ